MGLLTGLLWISCDRGDAPEPPAPEADFSPVFSRIDGFEEELSWEETDSLKIPLSKIFAAKEGAEVTIATSMPGNILTMVKPTGV